MKPHALAVLSLIGFTLRCKSAPFLWPCSKERGGLPYKSVIWRCGQGLRAAGAARKGGNPRRGFPLYPLLRFFSIREFRALRRAAVGSAPGPRPLFCKKAGQKTFKRQSTSSPSPSPLGRVIQSVREADTLAAEWHLPREWERRVGPETSRGRHHPKSAFLWGSTPFLWARPKKWGGICSTTYRPAGQIGEFRQRPTLTAWQCRQ